MTVLPFRLAWKRHFLHGTLKHGLITTRKEATLGSTVNKHVQLVVLILSHP